MEKLDRLIEENRYLVQYGNGRLYTSSIQCKSQDIGICIMNMEGDIYHSEII